MGKTLYLECNAGISGDMTVGALLDLGADRRVLESVLKSLPVTGYEIEISRVKKAGVDCMDFLVALEGVHDNHDHDMEYLHGHSQETHDDQEHHHDHHHSHEHRGMKEVLEILEQGQMTENARRIGKKIFDILARAEAKAHGVPVEEVHFHEVGAVDSIVDIVAVAVCLDNLEITEVIVPKLCEGRGTVRCQHGILPVPVPAVANILQEYHLPVHFLETDGEFVTPTGAAIVAAVKTGEEFPENFVIEKIGMGAGKRRYEYPSILRAMLLRPVPKMGQVQEEDYIYKLESNIDDSTGENLGYVLKRLMEAGARDVHYMPVFMKKDRPAYQLEVICDEEKIPELEQIIFRETTTIGIRRQKMQRRILPREIREIETRFGKAMVKRCKIDDMIRIYPEYDSIVELCKKTGLSYQEIYHEIMTEGQREE